MKKSDFALQIVDFFIFACYNDSKNTNQEAIMNTGSREPDYVVINDDFAKEQKRQNGFSIASLVLGILSLACCCFTYIPLVLGILGVVFAVIDKKTNSTMNGMATAGMVCGIVSIAIGVLSIALNLLFPADEEFMQEYMQFLEELLNSMESEGEVAFRALPLFR